MDKGTKKLVPQKDYIRMFVEYVMPTERSSLEAAFSVDGVSEDFYGTAPWVLHRSRIDSDFTPGNREFLLTRFRRRISSQEAIDTVERGFLPATHLEAYALAQALPGMQRHRYIVAPGDAIGLERLVTVLSSRSGKRLLQTKMFELLWDAETWFLFVRRTI